MNPRSSRTTILIAVAAAVAAALAPPAEAANGGKKTREVAAQYVGSTLDVLGAAPCEPNSGVGCVVFEVMKGEMFISLDIVDASGQRVLASVYVNGYENSLTPHGHVCGSSKRPLRIGPGVTEVRVHVEEYAPLDPIGCVAVATKGTVTAVFSNLP